MSAESSLNYGEGQGAFEAVAGARFRAKKAMRVVDVIKNGRSFEPQYVDISEGTLIIIEAVNLSPPIQEPYATVVLGQRRCRLAVKTLNPEDWNKQE